MQEVNRLRFCKDCENYLDNDKFYEGLRRRVCISCLKKRSKDKWQRVKDKVSAFNKSKRLREREEKEGLTVRFYLPVYFHSIPVNEETIELEDEICKEFGCGKKLSLREKLFGQRCIKHSDAKPLILHNGKL